MAEVIGLVASIIAVVQLADRVATMCKLFIETVNDYPKDLRLIYIETGSLKVVFEGLHFLKEDDPADSVTLQRLQGSDGPIEGCKVAMDKLDQLFLPLPESSGKRKRANIQKLQMTLASLAWPLKAERARRLLDEIMRYKSTINTALQGQLLLVDQHIRLELRLTLSRSEFRNMKQKLDEACTTLNGKVTLILAVVIMVNLLLTLISFTTQRNLSVV